VEHLGQIIYLSQPLVKLTISDMLQKHANSVSEATINEVVNAVMDSNILLSTPGKGSELGSAKRRKTYVERNFPVRHNTFWSQDTLQYMSLYCRRFRKCSNTLTFLTKFRNLKMHHQVSTRVIMMGNFSKKIT